MEIIISLNAKMNNHIQTTRGDIQGIESKVQAMTVGSYLQNPLEVPKAQPKASALAYPPSMGIGDMKSNTKLLNLETEVERLRLDVVAQKENDRLRQEEMESFFKKASLEYFNKLRDTTDMVEKMRMEQMTSHNVVNQINLLEQELIDLKN